LTGPVFSAIFCSRPHRPGERVDGETLCCGRAVTFLAMWIREERTMNGSGLFLVACLLVLAGGCGVPESDYQKAVSERDELKGKLAKLEREHEALRERVLALENENKSLKERSDRPRPEPEQLQRTAQAKEVPKRVLTETKGKYYEVKKGDSLLSISRHTGVPVKTLRELNRLQGDKLQVGQRLRLAP